MYFLNLEFLLCCPTQPLLSLNFAFSPQEQSCSHLCRSQCVPCLVCSLVNPCVCVSLLGSKLFPPHCCRLSLSPAGLQGTPVHLSLLQTLLVPFTCCCFWTSHAVPIGLGAECSCSAQCQHLQADSTCALETGVGYVPLP